MEGKSDGLSRGGRGWGDGKLEGRKEVLSDGIGLGLGLTLTLVCWRLEKKYRGSLNGTWSILWVLSLNTCACCKGGEGRGREVSASATLHMACLTV